MVISDNGIPITWATKNQSLIAISTTKAEYISLASVAQHHQVAKRMCTAIGIMVDSAFVLNLDSQSVRSMPAKPHGTQRRNFIGIRHHFLLQFITEHNLRIVHVPANA